jgi:hypothetical protein
MRSSDPCYIPMIENIRELLKDTIFAHPDDVAAMIDTSKMMTKAKSTKKKK